MIQVPRYYESEKFIFYLKGASNDLRTNSWSTTCKNCKKAYEPVTTMLATQQIVCPKCGEKENVNYNELKVKT